MYVIVSGPPASGKSALARPLADRLGLPLIAKDTIKDALLEVLPVAEADVAASRTLGRAAIGIMVAIARANRAAVLESVWHRSYAVDDLRTLPGDVLEVFCRCDLQTLQRRFRARARTRHAGYFDAARTPDELWNPDTTAPVAGGWPVIEVDTSASVDVESLAHLVIAKLKS